VGDVGHPSAEAVKRAWMVIGAGDVTGSSTWTGMADDLTIEDR
jgi:hypothetical protein